jgi:site-specific DNA-methyltransferase (adenine-specific)
VFSKDGKKTNYYPIMREGKPYYRKRAKNNGEKPNNHKLGVINESETVNNGFRYPETVLYFQQKWRRQDQVHPTQKSVNLLEYLIKTYTNENNLVLDNCMGSGSTGVACVNTNRKFIGIEMNEKYFEIACSRIKESLSQPSLF